MAVTKIKLGLVYTIMLKIKKPLDNELLIPSGWRRCLDRLRIKTCRQGEAIIDKGKMYGRHAALLTAQTKWNSSNNICSASAVTIYLQDLLFEDLSTFPRVFFSTLSRQKCFRIHRKQIWHNHNTLLRIWSYSSHHRT